MLYYTPDIYEQIRAHTNEAMSYVAIGDDIKVEEYLDVICTSYPDSEKLPWAVYVIGEEYYKIGEGLCAEKRIVEALPYYQKAIDIWKQRILDSMPGCDHEAEAYLFSGICYDRLQQHQKAAEYLQKVIHDWPDYRYVGSAYDWYAECLEKMKTKGLVEADIANTQIEETYKVIIEEYPDYLYRTNICRKLGKFYFRNKRWPDAISHYNSLKGEENIPLVEILYSLGRCYEAVGDKVNAITSYTELLETDANKKYRYEVTSRLKSLSN
jgi:tetratricopeptide (TPR) repeat protein